MKTQEKSSQGMLRSAAVPTELPVQDPLTDRKGLLDLCLEMATLRATGQHLLLGILGKYERARML